MMEKNRAPPKIEKETYVRQRLLRSNRRFFHTIKQEEND